MQPRSMAARDWVFQVIRTAIVRGELPGDMPLRQDEISTALSVSHIPVREAFRQLEAQGLVRIYPNRGAVVTKLSCKELSDVMDTRILLEVGALRLALPHITEEDLARARELLELFSKEKDPIKGAELNLKLHFSLYDPCDNQTLLSLIDQMHANVDRYITPFSGKRRYRQNCIPLMSTARLFPPAKARIPSSPRRYSGRTCSAQRTCCLNPRFFIDV